ncbi:MAG TPA: SUMF1/EgtB/PvdO family nonheme iron enzyme [Polyangiaceae bacterium]|nr:SUMF1/EgtB/PvdO family nonheme iron enzyme [Polyangiaceae bacterium]
MKFACVASLAALLVAAAGCGAAPQTGPQAAPAASPLSSARAVAPPPASHTLELPPLPPSPPAHAACPVEMVAVADFCIDRYEAPNVQGAMPLAMQTAVDGETWCASRGKHLCAEEAWVRACEGPHGRRYPYGDAYVASACNADKPWRKVQWNRLARWPGEEAAEEAARLYQGDPSGAHAACVSEEGVFDLVGNVAEWVRRGDAAPHPGYDHVLKGCYWAGCYHQPEPDCEFRNRAHPSSFRTYEAGFRCCLEPPAR